MGGSLRAELVSGSADRPSFAVLLPDGWRFDEGDADRFHEEVLSAVEDLPPDVKRALEPGVRQMVQQAKTAPGSSRVELAGVIRQVEAPEDQFVPMSLTVHWFRPPTGATVQAFGLRMMETREARPLEGSSGVLRWMESATVASDGESGEFGGPTYLIPIEGNKHLALLIRTVLPMPEHPDANMDFVRESLFLLSDSIVTTLRWKREAVQS